MSERKAIRRALVSVYDKTGLVELATGLHAAGVELVSTGSTAGKIAEALYSLFSGFVLLASAGVVAAPIVHRVFHRFHVDDRER